MQKQIAIRLIIGLLAIAGLFIGWQKFSEFAKDPDLGNYNSVGEIVAIDQSGTNSKAVIFSSDGKAKYPKEKDIKNKNFRDSELSWSADGQRVFISSNRMSNSYSVHRWNPETDDIEVKRENSRFQSAPYFDAANDPQADQNGLITSAGSVLDYNVRSGITRQILPPVADNRVVTDEGGSASPMSQMFDKIGSSFKTARWTKDRMGMFATMKGDAAEAALVVDFSKAEASPPMEIVRGNRVKLDMSTDGRAVIMVQGFRFPDSPDGSVANVKQEKPFLNALMIVNLDSDGRPKPTYIMASADDKVVVGDFAISPKGDKIAVVVGTIDADSGSFIPQGLAIMPFEEQGAVQATPILLGEVGEISFSPDGAKLAFIKREGSFSNVYRINVDGSGETKISPDGRYASPIFSPQIAGASK